MTQPEETTAANLLLVNTVHHVLSAHVGSETDHRTGRTTYKASLKVEGLEPWVDVRGEAAAELFDAMPQLPVHLLLLSGPSAADTAALIARLHEQLTESNQARDHWEGAHDRMKAEQDRVRAELEASKAERTRQCQVSVDTIENLCRLHSGAVEKEVEIQREQRARAEKAEAELKQIRHEWQGDVIHWRHESKRAESAEHKVATLEGELSGALATAKTLYADKNKWAGLCSDRERERDQARAEFATVDRMLVERTREREEARADCNHNRDLLGKELARGRVLDNERDEACEQLAVMTKQRDSLQWHNDQNYMRGKEAMLQLAGARDEIRACREQLAKLEWSGLNRPTDREPLLPSCPVCQGFRPDEDVRRSFKGAQIGHRPGCWFGKKKTERYPFPRRAGIGEVIVRVGESLIRNHVKGCPARSAEDVAWVDSHWINGRAPKHEVPDAPSGPRPKPIGCDGCKCEKPPTLRERWKAKQAACDHWMDACGYMLMGVDFAGGNTVTVATDRPVQPGASFVYDQSSGIWKLVDEQLASEPGCCSLCLRPDVASKPHPNARCAEHAASESSRPEPKFKVGQKVWAHGKTHTIASSLWHALFSFWSHRMETGETVSDHDLKPAPKFAVGKWVTCPGGAGGVQRSDWTSDLHHGPQWVYVISRDDEVMDLKWESEIAAQTPQHKHDCRGCVFLGRMGDADLYLEGDKRTLRAVYSSDGCCISCTAAMGPDLTEARRRAVARGLV